MGVHGIDRVIEVINNKRRTVLILLNVHQKTNDKSQDGTRGAKVVSMFDRNANLELAA